MYFSVDTFTVVTFIFSSIFLLVHNDLLSCDKLCSAESSKCVYVIIIIIIIINFKQLIHHYIPETTMSLGQVVLQLFCSYNLQHV
jgi:hypothetical protein